MYKVSAIAVDGEQYPLIWGSHNCNSYVMIADKWFFSDFATSFEQAKNKSKAFILATSNSDKLTEDKQSSYWLALLEIFSTVFPYKRNYWESLEYKNVELPPLSAYLGIEIPFTNKNGIIGYTYVFFDKSQDNTYSHLTGTKWDSRQATEIAFMLSNTLANLYRSIEHNEPEVETPAIVSNDKFPVSKVFIGELKWQFTLTKNDDEYEIISLIAKKDGKILPAKVANCFIAMDNELLSYFFDTEEKMATSPDTFGVTSRFREMWASYQKYLSASKD